MRIDTLRLVGSAQTNRAMEAELVRIAGKTVGRRPPAPKRDGTGQLAYPWDEPLATAALAYHRTSTRVVRDLYTSSARRLEPLYDELAADVAADDRGWDRAARTISSSFGTTRVLIGRRSCGGVWIVLMSFAPVRLM